MNLIGFESEFEFDLKVIILLKKKLVDAPKINEIIFDKDADNPNKY